MIYDYRCTECKDEITIERKMTDEALAPTCFVCHITMVRKWDAPTIQFKGKGFYSNGG
jgi:putative FmdB family regulatory protein